jgi:hypothetical protein
MSRLLVNMKRVHRIIRRKASVGQLALSELNPLHKTIDHLLLPGFFEGDGELVAV